MNFLTIDRYHRRTSPFKTPSIVIKSWMKLVLFILFSEKLFSVVKLKFFALFPASTRWCIHFSSFRPSNCSWRLISGPGSHHASRKATHCTALMASTTRWRVSSHRSNIFSSSLRSSRFKSERGTWLVSSSKDKKLHLYLSLLQEEFLF